MHELTTIILQAASPDLTAMAAMLAIVIGISSIVGVLIARIVVKPIVDEAKNEILSVMVPKNVFDLYATTDQREHEEMKQQLTAIANRNTHR
jgi:hypothetical protein